MKSFLIIGGLFIIVFISIIPFPRNLKEYNIQKNGDLVTVTLTHIPYCFGTKIRYFVKFNYAGKQYDKKVGCGWADKYKEGDIIKMKHIEGSNIFLFENEKIETEFIATGMLALFGIYFIVIGLRYK